jgi:hypothetical protein
MRKGVGSVTVVGIVSVNWDLTMRESRKLSLKVYFLLKKVTECLRI